MTTRARPDPVADPQLRQAGPDDALCLSVLAMQVFLDTYAMDGIRPSIAREVLAGCSQARFAAALAGDDNHLVVAERRGHLIGFVHVALASRHALAPAGTQAELLRLYVQEPHTGAGIGTALLAEAERRVAGAGATVL